MKPVNEATGDAQTLFQVGRARDINVTVPPVPATALRGTRPSTPSFTGRQTELDELATTSFVVVSGMAGVGKTELVLRFAEGFAGDRLFCDFHGYDNRSRTPGEALEKLLVDLGVREIPAEEGNRESLFRTYLADRDPVLIVLDNVSSAAQVRPLLVPGHRIVVTSRHRLTGLDGVHHLTVPVLPTEDAIALVGDEELAKLCGNLPLALQIMAALQRSDPGHDWAADLREARLDTLEHDGEAVHAAFDLSFRSLPVAHQKLFPYLAMLPGEGTTAEVVAALVDRSTADARKLLRDLRSAHLLEADNGMHDLVRCYARGLLEKVPDRQRQEKAFKQLLRHIAVQSAAETTNPGDDADWFLAQYHRLADLITADSATRLEGYTLTLWLAMAGFRPVMSDSQGESLLFHSVEAARALGDRVFEAESLASLGHVRNSLQKYEEACSAFEAALRIAADLEESATRLRALSGYTEALIRLRRIGEAVPFLVEGARESRQCGDTADEAYFRINLGTAYNDAGRPEDARDEITAALSLFRENDNRSGEVHAMINLGVSLHLMGHHDERGQVFRDALKIAESIGLDSHAEVLRDVLGVS